MVLVEVLWFVRLVLVKEAGGEAGDVTVKQIDGQSHGPVQRLRLDVRPLRLNKANTYELPAGQK